MRKAYLVLKDGHIFEGEAFGADAESCGELVFTTGVTGYIESLSDPDCCGQIITYTFPQLGNYGINHEDMESLRCHAGGVIVREWCPAPSNFRSVETLDDFLRRDGVPGVCGVDTRQIAGIIRESGVMPAFILREKPSSIEDLFINIPDTEADVSRVREPVVLSPQGKALKKVALIDYGVRKSIIKALLERSCEVTLLPRDTSFDEILEREPDGVMLSNGPGDPRKNTYCIKQIRRIFGKLPIFGIGLGHELLALAAGGGVLKLKHGHRGSNQPVRELETGLVYITSQNHGYAAPNKDLDKIGAKMIYANVNDGSCEGLAYPDAGAFSLQFQPEAISGPQSMAFTFDRFIEMMGGAN